MRKKNLKKLIKLLQKYKDLNSLPFEPCGHELENYEVFYFWHEKKQTFLNFYYNTIILQTVIVFKNDLTAIEMFNYLIDNECKLVFVNPFLLFVWKKERNNLFLYMLTNDYDKIKNHEIFEKIYEIKLKDIEERFF